MESVLNKKNTEEEAAPRFERRPSQRYTSRRRKINPPKEVVEVPQRESPKGPSSLKGSPRSSTNESPKEPHPQKDSPKEKERMEVTSTTPDFTVIQVGNDNEVYPVQTSTCLTQNQVEVVVTPPKETEVVFYKTDIVLGPIKYVNDHNNKGSDDFVSEKKEELMSHWKMEEDLCPKDFKKTHNNFYSKESPSHPPSLPKEIPKETEV